MSVERMHGVHATANRQQGLVTLEQLTGLGVPGSTVMHWAKSGRLRRIEHGVYLVAGAPLTWKSRLLAASLSSKGLASHRSGAYLYGVPRFRPGPRDLMIAWDQRWSGDARLHRTRHFHEVRPTWIDGIPTVDPVQLSLDLTSLVARRQISPDALEDAIDHLVRNGHLDEARLVRLADLAKRRRIPGSGRIRRLIDEYIEDTTESRLEHEYVQLVVAAGLPRPRTQHEIHDADGSFIARADNAWVAELVLAEIDSVRHHLHRQAFEEDRRKRNRLRVAGWLVLEFTARMIRRHPDQVLRDTAQALAARR